MRFFPREKGKTAFFKEKPSTKAFFPFSRGKNHISQGVENRGSLISVPLALRDVCRGSCQLQHRISLAHLGCSLSGLTVLAMSFPRPAPKVCSLPFAGLHLVERISVIIDEHPAPQKHYTYSSSVLTKWGFL